MTLIEVLVTISVVAILISLLIPAVQMAREASRRTRCASNLRQIGLALSAYASDYGVYPMSNNGLGYSPQVMILPYLEQRSLYDSLNTTAIRMTGFGTPEVQSFWQVTVSTFVCPTDPLRPPHGYTNYAGNRGVGYDQRAGLNNGLFNSKSATGAGPVSPGSISDGLSNTAAFSEWLIGPLLDRPSSEGGRIIYQTTAYPEPTQFKAFMAECNTSNLKPAPIIGKGLEWMHGDVRSSLYNHDNPPNRHTCLNAGRLQKSAWTAASRHRNGVNLLMVDGSVGFRGDSIQQEVWRGLGTRAGGEITPAD